VACIVVQVRKGTSVRAADFDVFCGVDAGKQKHPIAALAGAGNRLFDRGLAKRRAGSARRVRQPGPVRAEDQAAGLIFHVQDKDNYDILRANALENNGRWTDRPVDQSRLAHLLRRRHRYGALSPANAAIEGRHVSGQVRDGEWDPGNGGQASPTRVADRCATVVTLTP